jgi:hypothetical protein
MVRTNMLGNRPLRDGIATQRGAVALDLPLAAVPS